MFVLPREQPCVNCGTLSAGDEEFNGLRDEVLTLSGEYVAVQ